MRWRARLIEPSIGILKRWDWRTTADLHWLVPGTVACIGVHCILVFLQSLGSEQADDSFFHEPDFGNLLLLLISRFSITRYRLHGISITASWPIRFLSIDRCSTVNNSPPFNVAPLRMDFSFGQFDCEFTFHRISFGQFTS